jgi:two-component system chemotaxis sensor kinase CheA
MDELLRDFLTETHESIDVVDVELVRFERDPNNASILNNVFRLVHTIKGTCGFLNLPRLEALTHAAEALMGKFRDGARVTGEAVTLVLETIDRVKILLDQLERNQAEPAGDDRDLIVKLERMAAVTAASVASPPNENVIDQLERAFRDTPAPRYQSAGAIPAPPAPPAAAPPEPPASAPSPKPDANGDTGHDEERADSKVANQSIRVHVDTLEQLMTMVSELVLTRNQLLDIGRRHEDSEFKAPLQRLSTVTAELQEGVMKTRMQPIGNAWQKLPRVVRDLSAELGKPIEFEMQGAETELDRQVLDQIKDPLIHMVRNSADHGLEMPAERRAAGKPEKGTIRLAAWHEGGHIIVEVSDDGRGLDTARIKSLAVSRGLVSESEAEKMTESQIQKFIFMPGFSTASKVTSVSGRGIGMDVVRANMDQIGGVIDVKSVLGHGTSFIIKIPLTLAIVSALIVQCAGDRFAIPQLAVVELVRARNNSEHRIERIKDAAVLRLRNKLLPLFRLSSLLKIGEGAESDVENGFIVVTQVGSQTFGVVVDAVFHTEEIVVKPMSGKLRHIPMFSGNTILGDGSVIMIIDPNGIVAAVGTSVANAARDMSDEHEAMRNASGDQMTSLLVFRAGSAQPKAVPLALVTRLEEIEATKIENSNGRFLVQYRDQLMPLVEMEGVSVRKDGVQPILVFADDGRSMGLVVDEIVDIVEERLNIEVASNHEGILGSAVIKGQATEVIDVGHFLPMAFADWFSRKEMKASMQGQSILLVDDSAFFRNMLAPVLKAAGYRVSIATNAKEGLGLLRSGNRFDAILTDIEMPEMNGFEFAETIRADHKLGQVPIIALSSMISPAAIERGRQAGFHDYVAKFDRPGLIAALKEQTAELSRAA